MSSHKIVVVEDEPDILELVTYNLEREGFGVQSTLEGDRAIALIEEYQPDLVILDLMLPGMDGLEICRRLKENEGTVKLPIIMMTAKSEESDIVLGLDYGADDYIPKPFKPRELVARIKAVLRRSSGGNSEPESEANVIKHGVLEIRPDKYQALLEGQTLKMTLSEFKILNVLAKSPERVFSREQLLRETVGDQVIVVDRNIDVHIRSIRKALGEYKGFIETVRGVGYRFQP